MNLFEYEGKQMMNLFHIPVPESHLLVTAEEPAPMDYPFVLKAQVMTGGRGKAGGVKVCRDDAEYRQYARQILPMEIKGHSVHGLLAEKMVKAEREFYLSITLQGVAVPTLIVSAMGGMDIEQVSREHPEEILKIEIDPFTRLKAYQKKQIANHLGLSDAQPLYELLDKLQNAFFDSGALLVEINPLGLVAGKLVAMDSKFVLDDHASSSAAMRAQFEEKRVGLYRYHAPEAEKTTITYVPLEGNVGLISDGAGTGMLTLDLLRDAGLSVASFCELGGMTTPEVMYRAMELTLENHPGIKALIVVLIGGFNRMDNMAAGLTAYCREHQVKLPIFCRMCGTMQEEGIRIMEENDFVTFQDLTQTVEAVAEAVKEG